MSSRSLGATFERSVATQLRKWLGPDWTVSRNPTDRQKGQDGGQSFGEFSINGPLETVASWSTGTCRVLGEPQSFPLTIECKRDKRFKESQLWKPGVSAAFREFWAQAVKQAEAAGKKPWLILREPPRGTVLSVMEADRRRLVSPEFCLVLPADERWSEDERWLTVCRLEDFLSEVPAWRVLEAV